MDQAAVWLAGSILFSLGLVAVIAGFVAINNILHRYWKPVRIFTPDSFHPFTDVPRYATEEEVKLTPKFEEFKKK